MLAWYLTTYYCSIRDLIPSPHEHCNIIKQSPLSSSLPSSHLMRVIKREESGFWWGLKDPDVEKTEGRRRRGQQKIRWLDGIIDTMDMSLSKLQEIVKDREAWGAMVHLVSQGQTQLSDWKTTQCMYLGEKWIYIFSAYNYISYMYLYIKYPVLFYVFLFQVIKWKQSVSIQGENNVMLLLM